jgi:hypothetical protein
LVGTFEDTRRSRKFSSVHVARLDTIFVSLVVYIGYKNPNVALLEKIVGFWRPGS